MNIPESRGARCRLTELCARTDHRRHVADAYARRGPPGHPSPDPAPALTHVMRAPCRQRESTMHAARHGRPRTARARETKRAARAVARVRTRDPVTRRRSHSSRERHRLVTASGETTRARTMGGTRDGRWHALRPRLLPKEPDIDHAWRGGAVSRARPRTAACCAAMRRQAPRERRGWHAGAA